MKLNLQVSLTNISFSQQIQNVMSYNNISSERLYIYTHTHTHTLGIFNKLPNIIGDSRGKNRFLNDVYVCVCVCVYDLFIYLFWRLWTVLHQYNFTVLGMVICTQGLFSALTILIIRERKIRRARWIEKKRKDFNIFFTWTCSLSFSHDPSSLQLIGFLFT